MPLSYKHSIVAGICTFIMATSCCWLPGLLIAIGGTSGLVVFSHDLGNYNGILMTIALLLIGFGIYKFGKSNHKSVILQSTIICPKCGHKETKEMPTNACQYFYTCKSCDEMLKPLAGDCCVYCSYGSVSCPPIQIGNKCCN